MALLAGADDTASSARTIKIPPKTIAKVAWPLGKLRPLGSGPVSHKSGRALPTSSFSSSPNSRGTPLSSTTRASTRRPLTSRNSNSPRHHDHRSYPAAQDGDRQGRSVQPSGPLVLPIQQPLHRPAIAGKCRVNPRQHKHRRRDRQSDGQPPPLSRSPGYHRTILYRMIQGLPGDAV